MRIGPRTIRKTPTSKKEEYLSSPELVACLDFGVHLKLTTMGGRYRMTNRLTINLDATDIMMGTPRLKAGDLLKGSIDFESDAETYLNAITVQLRWSLEMRSGKAILAGPNEKVEVADEISIRLPTDPRSHRPDQLSNLIAKDNTRTVVDERLISRDTTPDFVHDVVPNRTYSWRFTMQAPREPWTYAGRLFRIDWEIEASADTGRGLRRRFSKLMQMGRETKEIRSFILLPPPRETL